MSEAVGTLQGKVEHLKKATIFQEIKSQVDALEAFANLMEERRFAKGDVIITEGETKSEMYVLVKGDASIYKSTPQGDQYKVAIIHGTQNACFGEGGLLGADARSATIKADTECLCLVIDGPRFESFCGHNPKWAIPIILRITHSMMNRLRKSNNDLMLLYNALVAEIRGR